MTRRAKDKELFLSVISYVDCHTVSVCFKVLLVVTSLMLNFVSGCERKWNEKKVGKGGIMSEAGMRGSPLTADPAT